MSEPIPSESIAEIVEVVWQARSQSVAGLVEACARNELPFSGPDSLCAKVAAMGFSTTTSLYPAVLAARTTKGEHDDQN